MSNRSLIEINHDLAGEIEREPSTFMAALTAYLASGSDRSVERLGRFGIRVFGMRHHSDAFIIEYGGHKKFGTASSK